MDNKSVFQSKPFAWAVGGIGLLIVLLVVFRAGMYVGLRQAAFSYRGGGDFSRMSDRPPRMFFRDFVGQDFVASHGIMGMVTKIENTSITIKGPGDAEKTLTVDDQTTIRRGMETLQIADLKLNDRIVVIGSPNNDGTIQAKLIRVIDPSEEPRMPFPGDGPPDLPRFF
ncbi:MAG: DUF5666 domain-containing protein [Patescibacteria group bacterium]|nr:DUF5666 domain-containing protein [Patescibacteria group bacterium]